MPQYTINNIMKKTHEVIPFEGKWETAFAQPQRSGTWLIWGNSGNGKSEFAMQLAVELNKFGKVLFLSLEEGVEKTFKERLERCGATNLKNFLVVDTKENLTERLQKRKSADFIIIDSLQALQFDYHKYLELKNAFPTKLFVYISHCEGKTPSTRTGRAIMYDANMKIIVSGYVAQTKGRSIGKNGGKYVIWEEFVNNQLTIKN